MDKVFTGTILVEVDKGIALENAVKAAKSLLYTTKADKVVFEFNGIGIDVTEVLTSEDIIREYYSNF